jgi:hypothetical protein
MLPLCTKGYGHLVLPEKWGKRGDKTATVNLFEEWGCYVLDTEIFSMRIAYYTSTYCPHLHYTVYSIRTCRENITQSR